MLAAADRHKIQSRFGRARCSAHVAIFGGHLPFLIPPPPSVECPGDPKVADGGGTGNEQSGTGNGY